MRKGVEGRRTGDERWQPDRQLGIVNDGFRLDDCVLACLLATTPGQPVDRGLLAARVRGRHGDDGDGMTQRQRLGETRRRTTSDADHAIDRRFGRSRTRPFSELRWHMLRNLVPSDCQP